MKKLIWATAIILLLAGSQAFAADGDLIVNGKVGVGTATPQEKLEVKGTIKITNPSGGTGGIKFPDNTVMTTAAVPAGVVPVYRTVAGCQYPQSFTTSATCTTVVCAYDPTYYYSCSGVCGSTSPTQCDNTLLGRLLP